MAEADAQAVEAALRALAESIDAQIELFKEERIAAGAEEYRATQVYSQVLQSGAFLTPFQVVDGAANRTRGWTLNNPIEYGTQAVTYIQRITPAGVMDREAIITPEDDSKADGSSGVQSGTKLIVMPTAHALAAPPRENGVYEVGIDGWCVEYPADHPQVGKAGAFVASEGGGGGGGVTHEQIVAAVREVIGLSSATLVQAIAGRTEEQGGNIRQGFEDKVKDAIAETRVVTEEMFTTTPPWEGGKSSPIIYEQLKNTSHSGGMSSLEEYGAAKGQ